MVLLTSSAVSVAISSGVICVFTLLLFLSGYLLQQQSVRNLQEALRRPPEPIPKPTLPLKFQLAYEQNVNVFQFENKNVVAQATNQEYRQEEISKDVGRPPDKDHLGKIQQQPMFRDHFLDALQGRRASAHDSIPSPDFATETRQPQKNVAYITTASHPSQVCSVLLLFKSLSDHGVGGHHILLYPSAWESDFSNKASVQALHLLRKEETKTRIIYHPVQVSYVWQGVTIESQLLGELQRYRWDYDRMMYLRTPGLAVNVIALDTALRFSSLEDSWMPIADDPKMSPSIMLISNTSSLFIPKGPMKRLTAWASTSHADHHKSEIEVEAAASTAGYMIFNEKELAHRRGEREWYGSVFERFERGCREVCGGADPEFQKGLRIAKRKR